MLFISPVIMVVFFLRKACFYLTWLINIIIQCQFIPLYHHTTHVDPSFSFFFPATWETAYLSLYLDSVGDVL